MCWPTIRSLTQSAVMALLIIGLAAATPAGADHSVSGPPLAGLQLGMTLSQFLERYPEAEVASEIPLVHCFGRVLSSDVAERAHADWNGEGFWLSARFHRAEGELRVNSIQFRSPADFAPKEFEALREALVARYGPYSRLLVPAKMNAARLVVGFEWAGSESYRRTYRIHHDTHGSGNDLFATQQLTDWFAESAVQQVGNGQQRKVYERLRDACSASVK